MERAISRRCFFARLKYHRYGTGVHSGVRKEIGSVIGARPLGVSNANRYARGRSEENGARRKRTEENETVMAKGNGPSRCDVCPVPLAGFTRLPFCPVPQPNNRRIAGRPKCSENLSLIVFGPDHRSISHRGNEFSRA